MIQLLQSGGFEQDINKCFFTRHFKESDLFIAIDVDECDSIEALFDLIDQKIAAELSYRE